MKKLLILLIFLPFICYSQNYNVASIPDSLKQNANVVKRFEELHVIIKSTGKAVVKHKYAVTILNAEGDEYAQYGNGYNSLHSLYDISGHLYSAEGKELKSVKKRDIADRTINDEESLVSDTRVKTHDFFYRDYPYTVEYEDEVDYDGIFFLPDWQPVEDEKYSVEQSSFIVETPADYNLRYKQFNYKSAPSITGDDKTKIYRWQVNNTKSVSSEEFQPPLHEVTTSVYISPTDFEIGGYKGNMGSWQNLGKFINDLNKDRDVLPEPIKKEIHSIADNVTNQEEKVKLLYNYLQKNTRYISITLGIGSWQPFDANFVASKKYGDCKALSNYMKSILKEAGVKSNYVLITAGAGKNGLWEDFPSPYFSHAILCVPGAKDTIWLECTSQTESPGYMGTFTGSRKALLIDDDGGHVVSTPSYNASDNLQITNVVANVDGDGNLVADVNSKHTGIQQELQHALMYDFNQEQREKYLNRVINLPTYKVEKSDYSEKKGKVPVIDEYLHISSPSYASVSGKRLFLVPNLFNKQSTRLKLDSLRKFDVVEPYAYRDIDTVSLKIPDGYSVEAAPKNISITNEFGSYDLHIKIDGDNILFIRSHEGLSGRFPPSEYNNLVKFYDDMYKADRSKIVFVKKDS